MIDVTQQINAVRRTVGTRVLEAGQARTVTISRTYGAAIEDVWDACTNAERIPRWFLPVSGDLRLHGRYQLLVIDIYQQPGLAQDNQIVATPTLIKEEPLPRRILIGDFSRDDRVLAGLSLAPLPHAS